jgi:predicted nucleic acid-binding protein
MRQPKRPLPKTPDYPEETTGSRLAAKNRKLASKLTPEQEAEHFRRGMALIYGSQSKEILALDTNLLLDLAGQEDFAHEFKEEFSRRDYSLFVPPTVVAELAFFATLKDAPQQEIAAQALQKISFWKCQPITLSSTQLAIAMRFATRLMESSLIPETEQNDGKILAQTSLAGIPMLVTSDKHLVDIDEAALMLAFNEADLSPVHPVHPKRLLRALR